MRPKTVFKTEGLPPALMRERHATTKKIDKEDYPTIPRVYALAIGQGLLMVIRNSDPQVRASFAGSIRRETPDIHDIDILISPPSDKVRSELLTVSNEILWNGPEKMSFVLEIEDVSKSTDSTMATMKIQVDIRFVKPESWGSALQYFTGSREHNISLRSIAKKKGLTLNEHGLFDSSGKRIDDGSEGSLYKLLGLRWLPPKYRNGYFGEFRRSKKFTENSI